MVRYIGPRLRIVRRLGVLPGLTRKSSKLRKSSPGQHGKRFFIRSKRLSLAGDFRDRLFEKQKLRFNYGVTEKQLVSYYHRAKKSKSSTGTLLLQLLESRLDCILYRLGFAPTIPAARQLITHRHILVNGKLVNIPSFLCCKDDIICAKENIKSKKVISGNLDVQQQKRNLILRRIKQTKLRSIKTKHTFKSLLPNHLKVDEKNLEGKFLFPAKRKSIGLRINELKVIEYYSR